jgi:hypothetical protein
VPAVNERAARGADVEVLAGDSRSHHWQGFSWRFSKSPLTSRCRREHRLPLNHNAGKSQNKSR